MSSLEAGMGSDVNVVASSNRERHRGLLLWWVPVAALLTAACGSQSAGVRTRGADENTVDDDGCVDPMVDPRVSGRAHPGIDRCAAGCDCARRRRERRNHVGLQFATVRERRRCIPLRAPGRLAGRCIGRDPHDLRRTRTRRRQPSSTPHGCCTTVALTGSSASSARS